MLFSMIDLLSDKDVKNQGLSINLLNDPIFEKVIQLSGDSIAHWQR